jgi:hypothetical protein
VDSKNVTVDRHVSLIYFKYVLMLQFNILLNVAVGGTYFPDNIGNRPWSWDGHPKRDFWENRSGWQSTWNGEDAALKIDYVRVYQE